MPSSPIEKPHSIIPVILAGGSNLEAWPVSRIQAPLQFQQRRGELSLFQQALTCAARVTANGSNDTIISVPALSVTIALQQMQRMKNHSRTQTIVEPVERGDWPAAVICALKAAQSDRSALMIFIDAANPPLDIDAFERLVQQMRASPLASKAMVVCGEPSKLNANVLQVTKSGATPDSLLHTCSVANTEADDAAFSIGKVAFATPKVILETADRRTLETCTKAHQMAQAMNGTIWPAINVWSNLQDAFFFETIANNKDALLRPVELGGLDRGTRKGDDVYTEQSTNCSVTSHGHLIAVAGVADLEIVATRDATFIAHKDAGSQKDVLMKRLRAAERPELFRAIQTHQEWGIQTELDRRDEYAVLRLEIGPDAEILNHLHNTRREVWQVISGTGVAHVGTERVELRAGTTLEIPARTIHCCRNNGIETLVMLETRQGNQLGDGDTVSTEEPERLEA